MEVQSVFQKLVWFGALVAASTALAQPKVPNRSIEKAFIDADKTISGGVDYVAVGIDEFLAGDSGTTRINRSKVVIENVTTSSEGQGIKNKTHLRVSLHLPNVEDSWALRFTTYDEDEEERDAKSRYLRDTPRQTNYGTSVAFFRKLGNIKTTFQPRIQLTNPLKVSHLLKFESESGTKNFKFMPKVELFAKHDKGTGVYTSLNMAFHLSEKYTLNVIDECEYDDRGNYFTGTNGLSLGQGVTKRSSLGYSLLFSSHNRETYHLESYTAATSWSHLLYKNVLHYQVIPRLSFAKSRGYKGVAGIAFSVSLIF